MTSKMRSLRDFRNPIGCLILLAAFAAAAGCSTAETTGGSATNVNHILPSGSSVDGWLATPTGGTHASTATLDYIAANGSSGCTECHGSDLNGGISNVSCFGNPAGCHHGPVANWTSPTVHGATAKKAPGSSGFASCQICHGSDFSGGGANQSCFPCHGANAPHPSQWNSTDTYKHSTTDPGNAAVCAQCHQSTPGTPGCFNNTLCHGSEVVPHPVGNPAWYATPPAPQPHGSGVNGAKAAPGPAAGFGYCQDCHGAGTDFAGGSSGVSCTNNPNAACHGTGVASPHPFQWRIDDIYKHRTTDTGNGTVCGYCHTGGSNSPMPLITTLNTPPGTSSCYNNTLCHGQDGYHSTTWAASSQHGPAAKALPSASTGFAVCQNCHGNGTTSPSNFGGGSAEVSCYGCHGVNAPHPNGNTWRGDATPSHRNTNQAQSNVNVCAQCHRRNPDPNPGEVSGCFNNTLCHGAGGVSHPVGNPAWYATSPAAQPHGNSAKATPSSTAGFAYCQVCHGTGQNFSGGTSGVSCTNNPDAACHGSTVASPHPSQWPSSNIIAPYHHDNTATGNAAVCAYCHQSAAGTPGCFNNTLCHGTGGVAHSVPYNEPSHYAVTSTTFPGSCSTCHDISAPSTKVGPVCQTCHVAASPLSATNCTSCHASPPNGGAPAGSVYPNIEGAHAEHLGLNTPSNPNGTPVGCDTCHSGYGTGTLEHYKRAYNRPPPDNVFPLRSAPGDVAFLATYNAQSGASSFVPNLFTCANVSCHGGTAPNWRTGAIDPNANCTICHKSSAVAPAQYNDYPAQAGENGHQFHLGRTNPVVGGRPINCTDCHSAAKLADPALGGHFLNLSTSAFEGLPSSTVAGTGTFITSYTAATRSCSPQCHGGETWPP